jgi:ribonuclease E
VSPTRKQTPPSEIMVVNDQPGEECRVAILEDGHLEELFTERASTATNVGNIYKGRVTNVEPAIQAAFVDYGEGQSGFLHISDLHPRYFPGKKRSERVGKKIPRHSRPPIQEALKRNEEVLVQVLKEGIGTKGPTLTSYLSIPGRLLVMMPEMDHVGVSRKVEDPEERRKMRKIIDTLTLPEGFGFILRTAGFGKTKTELNRDVAYLNRLWKVMEKRIANVGAPCELYTESDLLIRTIRDVLRPSIEAIVVDSAEAYERASAFLRVVAPRTAPKVLRYTRHVPIFHAYDIERQIDLIHSREVPLASGGKLVIDQTEALVAIDVNSGRSRSARDAETNAYRTNIEAVDEICRQLRLRDLGGLVINDLIDMHQQRHRRDIEDRFRAGLSRDRAKTTMLRISEFGIVELTRQRMRPSLRKSHFMPCPHCDGHGEIKSPETVGADAARQAEYLLQFERVRRLEIVCSPRVASVLLSSKRRELVRLEDESGKKVGVRVSDTISVDRVDFYAYDDRNADIDISKLPAPSQPTIAELERAVAPAPEEADAGTARKKRRRRRKSPPADATALALAAAEEDTAPVEEAAEAQVPTPTKKKRRRRRRRSKAEAPEAAAPEAGRDQAPPAEAPAAEPAPVEPIRIHKLAKELGVPSREVVQHAREKCDVEVKSHMSSVTGEAANLLREFFCSGEEAEPAPDEQAVEKPDRKPAEEASEPAARKKKSRRSRSRRKTAAEAKDEPEPKAEEKPAEAPEAQAKADEKSREKKEPKRRRRSRRGRGKRAAEPAAEPPAEPAATETRAEAQAEAEPASEADEAKPRQRTSSRRGRKKKAAEPAAAAAPKPSHNGDATRTKAPDQEKSKPVPPRKSRLYRSRRTLSRSAARQVLEEKADE